jgi:hypothetical protein
MSEPGEEKRQESSKSTPPERKDGEEGDKLLELISNELDVATRNRTWIHKASGFIHIVTVFEGKIVYTSLKLRRERSLLLTICALVMLSALLFLMVTIFIIITRRETDLSYITLVTFSLVFAIVGGAIHNVVKGRMKVSGTASKDDGSVALGATGGIATAIVFAAIPVAIYWFKLWCKRFGK